MQVAFAISYSVSFVGVTDSALLDKVKGGSDLVKLKPPSSIAALNYRIEADIPQMIKIVRADGYYDVWIETDLVEDKDKVVVNLIFHMGPRYLLKQYSIIHDLEIGPPSYPKISLSDLNVEIESPITSLQIVNAELDILNHLANFGYPLASVDNRDIAVDMKEKRILITENIHQGPRCLFGPLQIIGNAEVREEYVLRRIPFSQGQLYSANLMEQAQKTFIDTNLFSSAIVTHAEQLNESGELPMKLHLTEAKHRNFSIGVSYATIDGFGGTFSWVHRNLRGMGETLNIELDVSKVASVGNITYTKPDFLKMGQNYSALGEVVRENVVPYLAFTYRIGNRIDRTFSPHLYGSFGLKGEYISVVNSISNGHFSLIGVPLYVRYSTANSLLNATKGHSYTYKVTPYFGVNDDSTFFLKQKLTANFYFPLDQNEIFVFAFRTQLGSITGSSLEDIPFNKRFLGGSDDDLRGYRYKTVSPNDATGNPTGGRSAIYATFEPRIRLTEEIGVVPFTDWGTVSTKTYPDPNNKWFKSVGIGLRYFTFFGPLRADIAFPLNKRSRDPRFRIYISIGQTF